MSVIWSRTLSSISSCPPFQKGQLPPWRQLPKSLLGLQRMELLFAGVGSVGNEELVGDALGDGVHVGVQSSSGSDTVSQAGAGAGSSGNLSDGVGHALGVLLDSTSHLAVLNELHSGVGGVHAEHG